MLNQASGSVNCDGCLQLTLWIIILTLALIFRLLMFLDLFDFFSDVTVFSD